MAQPWEACTGIYHVGRCVPTVLFYLFPPKGRGIGVSVLWRWGSDWKGLLVTGAPGFAGVTVRS